MQPSLFTMGYEGLTIEAFIARLQVAQATPACLVCFEADYFSCHRTYVARAARQLGGPTVTHLTAKTALPDLGFQQAA